MPIFLANNTKYHHNWIHKYYHLNWWFCKLTILPVMANSTQLYWNTAYMCRYKSSKIKFPASRNCKLSLSHLHSLFVWNTENCCPLNQSIQWQVLCTRSINHSLVPYILSNYKAELQSCSEKQHSCWINNIPRPWIAANIHFQLSYLFYSRCQIKEPFAFWNFTFSL